MLITFKCITQESFQFDLEEAKTIGEVKQFIADSQGSEKFPVADQKLIYNGKVLDDADTIGSIGFDPKRFIVVMVKRQVKPASEPAKKEEEKPTNTEAAASKDSKEAPPAVPSTPANRAPPVSTPQAPARSNATVSAETEEKLSSLEAMGYPREEALNALRIAYGDVNRAVEYLINGIPSDIEQPPELPTGGNAEAPAAPEVEMEEDSGEEALNLDFLHNNEQFNALRDMVRMDPEMLPTMLAQISADNPELMAIIRENEAEFLALLNSDAEEAGNVGDASGGQQQEVRIPLTVEDRAAIDRLKDMGFPEAIVVEAYLACDKNEDLAVNYILSAQDDANQPGGESQH